MFDAAPGIIIENCSQTYPGWAIRRRWRFAMLRNRVASAVTRLRGPTLLALAGMLCIAGELGMFVLARYALVQAA